MTAQELIAALALPEATLLNQRVPKKLLLEHAASSAADRRLVQDGVEELLWLAALKPHLIGVPAFDEGAHRYVELAVLLLHVRPGASVARLLTLVHRAVPYPVVLLTVAAAPAAVTLSLAHLRPAQNEAGKWVLDGEVGAWPVARPLPEGFAAALALARQPQTDLRALYQGWMDTLLALEVARETGQFRLDATPEQAQTRRAAWQQWRVLQGRMAQLRAQAQRERQMARQVALNQTLAQWRQEADGLRRLL